MRLQYSLISASASGPTHSTCYVAILASHRKKWPARWKRHIQVSLYIYNMARFYDMPTDIDTAYGEDEVK